jgi:hypothetical protein
MNSENKRENKEIQETKGIQVALIIEVLGKPKEYLTDSLNKIVEQIDKEKGVVVEAKEIHNPKELENKKGFYTAFADIQVEVEEIRYLLILMFKYMPAHIEIIHPELIALTNHGWGDIINELTRRLHGYDEIARVLQLQNQQFRAELEKRGVKIQDSPIQTQEEKNKSNKKKKK